MASLGVAPRARPRRNPGSPPTRGHYFCCLPWGSRVKCKSISREGLLGCKGSGSEPGKGGRPTGPQGAGTPRTGGQAVPLLTPFLRPQLRQCPSARVGHSRRPARTRGSQAGERLAGPRSATARGQGQQAGRVPSPATRSPGWGLLDTGLCRCHQVRAAVRASSHEGLGRHRGGHSRRRQDLSRGARAPSSRPAGGAARTLTSGSQETCFCPLCSLGHHRDFAPEPRLPGGPLRRRRCRRLGGTPGDHTAAGVGPS